MNRALKTSDFKKVCNLLLKQLQGLAPYDTGNLAMNAIKIEFPSPDKCVIYVDEAIAPYMPFTTRPWVSPRWNGAKNPNEGWWQTACERVLEQAAGLLKGEIKHYGG